MIRIKTIAAGLLCVILTSTAIAQSDFDSRLIEAFGKKHLKKLNKKNPEEINILTYGLDHGYRFMPFPEVKAKESPDEFGEIMLEDKNNINIYKLGLTFQENRGTYLRIIGTDEMLVLKTKQQLIREMKTQNK